MENLRKRKGRSPVSSRRQSAIAVLSRIARPRHVASCDGAAHRRHVTDGADANPFRDLDEVGQSAALLAHEIRRPISGVRTALAAVASALGADHKEVLDDLLRSLSEIERLADRTLSFVRPTELQRVRVDLLDIARDAVRLSKCNPSFSEITFRLPRAARAFPVFADEVLLRRVFVNLFENARDAMNGTGVVRICAAQVAHRAVITIDDGGPGIDPRIADRLFELGATTKFDGTGLGLAISRRIVGAHGCVIRVVPKQRPGACFEVALAITG